MEPNTTPEQHETPTTTPATPVQSSQPVAADNNLIMGILCYLGPLVIVPYLMAKDEPFVHFHLKQGVVLAVIEIALYVLSMTMLFWSIWGLVSLLNLGCMILSIVGIIYVVQKKEEPLPLIGKLADWVKI